ncbi:MAG TPA: NAD-dependent epimerase/dehydratase family protein [Gemmatimonadaceae bacterium]|jgi:UDP-glucose 4-epimerase|nr:NAD-dependent epimerase/dehydratase family protein [Gemmatimonadaceae bacterium]
MKGRALITGGAGFIGSHLADRFVTEGWSTEILDDLSSGKRENLSPAVAFHHLDVRSPDAASLASTGGFDVIVHLAAQMDVRRSVADPRFDADVNIGGALNLCEAVRSMKGNRPRIVFSSTGGALYGDTARPPHGETTAKDPDSPYGVAKLAVEQYLGYYARVHGVETATVRYANVYGPRQDPHGEAGVVAIFCQRILAGRPLTIFGDGKQTRDYVHVKDVVDATYLAATRPMPPMGGLDARAFNVGTGIPTSVVDLAETLLAASGRRVPIEFAPKRAGEQMASYLTASKAESVLGWQPRVRLEAGLADTFAWFAAREPQPTLTASQQPS